MSEMKEVQVAYDVVMPQMGESIAEGTITTWLKKVGDKVNRDEPLFEISTDKVDAEIPSPAAGTLQEIRVQPGQTVAINTVVAVIADGSVNASTAPAAPAQTAAAPAAAAQPAPSSNESSSVEERRRTKSSPVVRKIAAEHGVNIAQLSGTGISGRVTKQDILGHLGGAETPTQTQAAAPSQQAPAASHGGMPDAFRPHVMEGDKVEDMSPMRAKIADHMVWSKRISPHVAAVFEIDFTHVDSLRKKFKAQWQEKYGVNLTFTSFIMKATVDAIKAFPAINASLDEHKVIYHRDINLGLAVSLDWGLLVPVIHKADELNMLGLSRRAADLAERARSKKLKPHEVQSGTFTITNPGIFGSLFGIPVINQPQVAIMGVGAIEKRPVVIDDMIGIRTRAYMAISFDHRLVDGAIADQFMSAVKSGIEKFDEKSL
jgi:pyruvate dehydrogenase E2 component (dihydrolipoamide acetyltransferase)